jgi:hypothetical protein
MGDLEARVVFLGRKRKLKGVSGGERRESIYIFYEYNKPLGSYNVS